MTAASAGDVYVSSPFGFTESGRDYYGKLLRALERRGFTVLDPWCPDGRSWTDERLEWAARAGVRHAELACQEIAQRNARWIEQANAVLAVLEGSDVDSGVAVEVGYAAAKGKPIVGLRSDRRRAADSVGSRINLQVSWAVMLNRGSTMTETLGEALERLDAACRRSRAAP